VASEAIPFDPIARVALLAAAYAGAATLIASAPVGEMLPTPYSAEEIRDAYRQGLAIWSERRVGDEVERTRTLVVDSEPERVRLALARFDHAGVEIGDRRELDASWDELRDHARFAAAMARRERAHRDTALGALEGWLYRVTDGVESRELFFADAYPGPPVTFVKMRAGRVVERVEIVRVDPPGRDAAR
jgi:hypothetical protein